MGGDRQDVGRKGAVTTPGAALTSVVIARAGGRSSNHETASGAVCTGPRSVFTGCPLSRA